MDPLPPPLSTLAPQVDALFYVLCAISLVVVVSIVGVTLGFVIRYRRRPGVRAQPPVESPRLQLAWTVLPIFVLAYLFHAGWQGYVFGAVAPTNAIDIHVTGKQWTWDFTHMPSGAQESNTLTVPIHVPIRLTMSSEDVLHSLFIPAFRVKRDVVPGMYTTLWFEATRLTPEDEPLPVFCAEYCGAMPGTWDWSGIADNTHHATMLARLWVTTREGYDNHLGVDPGERVVCHDDPDPMACWGGLLAREMGCLGCHTDDGTPGMAPTLRGLWGTERTFADGSRHVADERYIRTSLTDPEADVVPGFPTRMPAYVPTENRTVALVAYIRSLAAPESEEH